MTCSRLLTSKMEVYKKTMYSTLLVNKVKVLEDRKNIAIIRSKGYIPQFQFFKVLIYSYINESLTGHNADTFLI